MQNNLDIAETLPVVAGLSIVEQEIFDELTEGFYRLYRRQLPCFLTTRQLVELGVRPLEALNKDVVTGAGLLPLPSRRGEPRCYPLRRVIRFRAGERLKKPA